MEVLPPVLDSDICLLSRQSSWEAREGENSGQKLKTIWCYKQRLWSNVHTMKGIMEIMFVSFFYICTKKPKQTHLSSALTLAIVFFSVKSILTLNLFWRLWAFVGKMLKFIWTIIVFSSLCKSILNRMMFSSLHSFSTKWHFQSLMSSVWHFSIVSLLNVLFFVFVLSK